MELDFTQLPPRDAYAWMIGMIVPRPIAWVSTISAAGRTNLAPFSYFQAVSSNPPTLMFVPAAKRDGQPKDTLRNIREVPEFVVNLVSFELAEAMNATAAGLPPDESEFEAFGIPAAASCEVRPPRVAGAPVSFECRLDQLVPIGDGPSTLVLGRIRRVHVRDDVLGPDGRPDPARLDLIGRMGGNGYVRTTDRFELDRP